MNAKEAGAIIKNTPPQFNIAQPHVLYFEAQKYLEALSGPEVKILLEGLEKIVKHYPPLKDGSLAGYTLIAQRSLEEFKEAVNDRKL
jgi:hypothetical protein